MKLNQKQKLFIFTETMSKRDLVKIFETDDVEWLVKQKVELKEGFHGWKALFLDGEEYTQLNFPNNPGWNEVLNNIDEFDYCEWCEMWFEKSELHSYHRFRLCDRCKSYLKSRGE